MMRLRTKDQLEDALTGNPGLEAEGKIEKAAGKAQQKLGQAEQALEP